MIAVVQRINSGWALGWRRLAKEELKGCGFDASLGLLLEGD